MADPGYGPCLLLESGQSLVVRGESHGQHLDGHVALEPRVVCAIDFSHSAGPDRADNLIRTQFGSGLQGHFDNPGRDLLR